MPDTDDILRLPFTDPDDVPWPKNLDEPAKPSSSPRPQESRLVPIQPEPTSSPYYPADVITGDSLRQEYAAALKLHKPDKSVESIYPPEPPDPSAAKPASSAKRHRGRLDAPNNAHREESEGRRRRGGQRGNLNALKHGLYIDGRSIRNTTPIERAQLFDMNDIIANCKDYMRYTYEHGIRLNDMLEINETMRSLSLAAIGLTRLINTHAEYICTPYSSEFQATKQSTIIDLVEHYKKKLAPFMDLSDVITDPNAEK